MENKTIGELIRAMEANDLNGTTTSSKYVSFSMREDIEKTEAYLNSKHITGDEDYLNRKKPFFNIVIAARNIWFRATDIDVKNIVIRAAKQADETLSLLSTIKLQEFFKKTRFGQFLNDWGLTLASHGSAVVKFVEKDKELVPRVMDWNEIIVDAVDFKNNLKIEKIYYTPAQLRKQKNYDQELVKKLLENLTTRKTPDGQTKDQKSDYILVYEVHGELPLSLLTEDDKDEDTYVQQMHVVTFLEKKDHTNKQGFEDYALYKGREAKDPYLLTHLLKKDGQTYSGGAVKNLFEAQWMVNHSQKQIKDQLDLASKRVFQTSDGTFVGQNALTSIENGDILLHAVNQPLTMLNSPPDIVALQAFKSDWQGVAAQINGISEAMMGENPPAGSAWRQTQALLQESHSLFELMTENKGLAIIEMLTEFILPFYKKQLDNSDEIAGILSDHQIKQIDLKYLPNEVNRRVNQKKAQTILMGQIYDPAQEAQDNASAQAELQSNLSGNQRFISPSEIKSKTWKELFKDLEWTLDIDVTGESKDIQGTMATLTTVLQTLATNPGVLQDPTLKLVFSKILSLAGGFSPVEIQAAPAPQPTMMQQPMQPQPVPAGK